MRRRFGGSSFDFLARDYEEEQHFSCHPEESCEDLSRDAENANENDDYKKFSEEFGKRLKPCDCD